MNRKFYYYMALFGFFGLFILLMLWNTILVPSKHMPVAIVLLLTVTPLLIPLMGMLNGNMKSCTWMCYLSLFYFTHGVAEAYTTPAEFYYAILEIIFSLLLCTGAGLFVYKAEKIQ